MGAGCTPESISFRPAWLLCVIKPLCVTTRPVSDWQLFEAVLLATFRFALLVTAETHACLICLLNRCLGSLPVSHLAAALKVGPLAFRPKGKGQTHASMPTKHRVDQCCSVTVLTVPCPSPHAQRDRVHNSRQLAPDLIDSLQVAPARHTQAIHSPGKISTG